ncbi:MAG: hypothetical protein GC138_08060 [Gammaproteobacteria bacterium]|nr:hypothetical protein [Gammaproteobacteria bacterium]
MRNSHMPLYLIILLLFLSAPVFAETTEEPSPDRWYDIEVLIFTQQDEQSGDAEHREVWPLDPGSPDLKEVIELAPAPDETSGPMLPFALLPQDGWKLGEQDKKIRAGRHYTLLSHLAWRQPAPPSEVALPVHIRIPAHAETNPDEVAAPAAPTPEAIPEQPSTEEAVIAAPPTLEMPPATAGEDPKDDPEPSAEPPNPALVPEPVLDGVIRVSRNNYLHVDADLLYRPGAEADNAELPAALEAETDIEMPPSLSLTDMVSGTDNAEEQVMPTDYRMRQSRRVKKGELNFFDHPRFGLLIQIEPVEQATDATAPAAQ